MHEMKGATALLLIATLNCSSTARADAVGPPPESCPQGTEPRSCHGGPYCKPVTCTTSAGCSPNLGCYGQAFCMDEINCGGHGSIMYVDEVKGTCAGGAPCKVGICKVIKVCLASRPPDAWPPTPDLPPTPDVAQPVDSKNAADTPPRAPDSRVAPAKQSSCSCGVDSGDISLVPLLIGLVLLLLGRGYPPRRP